MGNRDFRFTDGFKGFCSLINSSFRVNITEEELSHVKDIGELYWMIADRYAQKYPDGCLTSSVFYSLRRGLVACGVERNAVKRNSSLVGLMPQGDVVQNWSTLETNVGTGLLPLRVYSPIEFGIVGSLIIGAGLMFYGCAHFQEPQARISFNIGITMVFGSLGMGGIRVKDPNADYLYPQYKGTIGEAASELLSFNFDEFVHRNKKWSSKDLFSSLQLLISYVSEHEPDEIKVNTKFEELYFDDGP